MLLHVFTFCILSSLNLQEKEDLSEILISKYGPFFQIFGCRFKDWVKFGRPSIMCIFLTVVHECTELPVHIFLINHSSVARLAEVVYFKITSFHLLH